MSTESNQDATKCPNTITEDAINKQRENYFNALRIWLHQAQLYQNLSSCMPYYLLSFQTTGNNISTSGSFLNNNYQIQGYNQVLAGNIPRNGNGGNIQFPLNDEVNLQPAEVIARHGGYEYIIPPLWKRFVAELVDFLVLFFLKLAITFTTVDFFEIIDLEKYYYESIAKNLQEDYQLAFEITSEIIIMEIIYRILVCLFEAFCLSGFGGRVGYSTPGKALLGLRVVAVTAIVPVENRARETVLLYPGSNLTFWSALCRAVIKNLLISLLFPLFFILFSFQHNRTGYDLLCSCIVVEENLYPPRRNRA